MYRPAPGAEAPYEYRYPLSMDPTEKRVSQRPDHATPTIFQLFGLRSTEERGRVCDRGAGSFLVLCWLRKMAKAMEPAERLDFCCVRWQRPWSRRSGSIFPARPTLFLEHSAECLCANKAVFAGRRGMLPPADPTHSGLTP